MKKLIYPAFILLSSSCFSQLMTNSNVPIAVTSGATITVNGGITSAGTTTINNNGIITLTGDFINNTTNNLFGTSAGTVNLNGGVQNIGGTTSTAFNNLQLTGTGNKTLLINASIGGTYASPSGILQLNDKTLFLNSKLLTINNSSPGAIIRTTGFIQSETNPTLGYGSVRWLIGNSAVGSIYTFPFGNNGLGAYLPLQMEITNPGTGSSGSITIATYPTASDNLPLPTGVSSLLNTTGSNNADKVLDRFWIIEPTDYISAPVSNLTFTYADIEHTQPTNAITESNLQMQVNNGTIWSPTPAGTANTVTNEIQLNNVNNYLFAWTAVDNSSPLPVELIFFKAEPIDNHSVFCNWITATEINNDFFTVQRSKNGIDFEYVGEVDGAGSSNSVLHYDFLDIDPYKGLSYYRLSQTDYDGTVSYSEVIAVHLGDKVSDGFDIYPNPASNILYLFCNTEKSIDIEIFDLVGRKVLSLKSDKKLCEINLTSLASGPYILKLNGKQKKFIKK